mmetsp:Transcript_34527/g.25625  ORF Transcript_34527/g.25625 Transcript_34527/m.25625 type:complete len:89 (-) Transcript_34527:2276-2542(-)
MFGYNSHVYSCFGKGQAISLFEDYKQLVSFDYVGPKIAPKEFIFNAEKQKLRLVAEVVGSNVLKVLEVDLDLKEVREIKDLIIGKNVI